MKLSPLQKLLATLALIGLSLVFCFPFVWQASTSLKVEDRIQSASTELIPRASFVDVDGVAVRVRPLMVKDGLQEVQLLDGARTGETVKIDPAAIVARPFLNTANYADGFRAFPFARYLFNTLVICALTVAGTMLSSSLVAYGLACVRWRGREVVFWVMLSTMMLPGVVTMLPVFMIFRNLGWIDTIWPLVVPAFCGNAFFVFLLRQFYKSIPQSLFEAARLDGCGDLRIWATIVLPLSKPALLVVALFSFLGAWNAYDGPLIYLMSDDKYTLSIGLARFQSQYGAAWGPMMAMSLVMTIPIIVLFFFTQKSFIQGVKLAGVKG